MASEERLADQHRRADHRAVDSIAAARMSSIVGGSSIGGGA
jgi:hypothetical protein